MDRRIRSATSYHIAGENNERLWSRLTDSGIPAKPDGLRKLYDPQAPPRLNKNKYLPNIHSGKRSQEVSFDWRSGEIGLWRTIRSVPGHRYTFEAWAKYLPSQSGLALYLGSIFTAAATSRRRR
jgi:hypothetical protein